MEAVHLGRDAIGVELEPRWADLARANVTQARSQGAPGTATVVTGDARHLPALLDPDLVGRVALVLTSPPYGSSIHGQVTPRPGRGVAKYDNTYSPDPANLGRVPRIEYKFESQGSRQRRRARPPRRSKLPSTNPLERVSREIGRRTDVAGVFPHDQALIRLAGSLLIKQHDEWRVSRCYLSGASMTELTATESSSTGKELKVAGKAHRRRWL